MGCSIWKKTTFIEIFTLVIVTNFAWAKEFPYLFKTSHNKSRGDTGIASSKGVSAIFYNPANLAHGKGLFRDLVIISPEIQISSNTSKVLSDIVLKDEEPVNSLKKTLGQANTIGLSNFSGIILKRAAFGAFAETKFTTLMFRNHKTGASESVKVDTKTNAGLVYSLASSIGSPRFTVGTTLKYIMRLEGDYQANSAEANSIKDQTPDKLATKGAGFGIDIGLFYKIKSKIPISLGLTIQDVGNTNFSESSLTKLISKEESQALSPIKQTINLGLAFEKSSRLSVFGFYFDVRDILNNYSENIWKRVHIGTKLSVIDRVGLLTGLNQGYPTVGFFIDTSIMKFDIGMYKEELGDKPGSRADARVFCRLKVGL